MPINFFIKLFKYTLTCEHYGNENIFCFVTCQARNIEALNISKYFLNSLPKEMRKAFTRKVVLDINIVFTR